VGLVFSSIALPADTLHAVLATFLVLVPLDDETAAIVGRRSGGGPLLFV
jgi:hypothetical protein